MSNPLKQWADENAMSIVFLLDKLRIQEGINYTLNPGSVAFHAMEGRSELGKYISGKTFTLNGEWEEVQNVESPRKTPRVQRLSAEQVRPTEE